MDIKINKKKTITPYFLITPIVVLSGLIIYYGVAFNFFVSFQKWNGISPDMKFIGFKNFIDLFSGRVLYIALRNNLIFLLFAVGIQAGLGLLIAVLLRTKPAFSGIFKSIFFFPVVMAPVVIASIFRIIMDPNLGSLNLILKVLHLDFLAVSWLGDPRIALFSIIIVNIFEWMGFSMIIYYAGLLTITNELYEAAKIDGSGFWTTLFKITIPMLRGSTTTLIVLGIVGSLKTFDIVVMLTGGGPGYSTEFMTTFLYKRALNEYNGGSAAAIGVIILILALIMSVIQIKYYNRQIKDIE